MQKLLVLIALVAVAYFAMRLFGSAARPKSVGADKRKSANSLQATSLKYDEKSGAYVPSED